MKKLTSHVLEPRAIVLGFTTFYFSSTLAQWIDKPFSQYHGQIFIATVLLISALSLVINKGWSVLLAGIMSGQLPFIVLAEFWRLSRNAELTPFSFEHMRIWWWGDLACWLNSFFVAHGLDSYLVSFDCFSPRLCATSVKG